MSRPRRHISEAAQSKPPPRGSRAPRGRETRACSRMTCSIRRRTARPSRASGQPVTSSTRRGRGPPSSALIVRAPENFATAARRRAWEGIVYLSGLGNGRGLSPHLASRQELVARFDRHRVGQRLVRDRPSARRTAARPRPPAVTASTVPRARPAAPAEPRSPAVGRCASMTSNARPRTTRPRPTPATSPLQRLLEGGVRSLSVTARTAPWDVASTLEAP
jgi:hypothetical protein